MRPDELIPVSCSLDYISLQYTTFTPVYTLYLTSAGEKETAKIEIWKCEIWNPPRFSWDSTFDLGRFLCTLLRKRNQTLFHFSYLGKIKRAQLALSNQIRGKIVVFVVSRTLVSLPPSAGPPLDLGLAMAAPRVSLLLIAHSERCFAPPSATMMPFICSVVLQDPPLGDGLSAPTVTPEVGGSSTKAPRHPSGLHLR